MSVKRSIRRGFTLIEILIVVIILGILAAIVIPQFTNASQEATESSMKTQLQTIRSQIELFKVRYNGIWPGTEASFPGGGGGDADAMFIDLTQPPPITDENGNQIAQAPFLQKNPADSAPAGFVYSYVEDTANPGVYKLSLTYTGPVTAWTTEAPTW